MTAFDRENKSVDGIVDGDRATQSALDTYRGKACVSRQRHEQLSWKYASLRTNFVRVSNGTIPFVLLIERKDGQPIRAVREICQSEDNGEYVPLDACAEDLGLVAEVWGAAVEEA